MKEKEKGESAGSTGDGGYSGSRVTGMCCALELGEE